MDILEDIIADMEAAKAFAWRLSMKVDAHAPEVFLNAYLPEGTPDQAESLQLLSSMVKRKDSRNASAVFVIIYKKSSKANESGQHGPFQFVAAEHQVAGLGAAPEERGYVHKNYVTEQLQLMEKRQQQREAELKKEFEWQTKMQKLQADREEVERLREKYEDHAGVIAKGAGMALAGLLGLAPAAGLGTILQPAAAQASAPAPSYPSGPSASADPAADLVEEMAEEIFSVTQDVHHISQIRSGVRQYLQNLQSYKNGNTRNTGTTTTSTSTPIRQVQTWSETEPATGTSYPSGPDGSGPADDQQDPEA